MRLCHAASSSSNIVPIIPNPNVPRRINGDIHLHLQSAAHISARRRNLVAHLHARGIGLRPATRQLNDAACGIVEIGNPNMVVAVHGRRPRSHQAAAIHAPRFRSVWTQNGDIAAAPAGFLIFH